MEFPTQSEIKLDVTVKRHSQYEERKRQANTNCLIISSMPASVKTGNTGYSQVATTLLHHLLKTSS